MANSRFMSKQSKILSALWRDSAGSMAIWGAAALPVMLGAGALSVDVSRMYNLEAQLQSAADAYARAGAAELDGRPDAISRAGSAVTNLVSNSEDFSVARGQITVASIRYLTDMPSDAFTRASADLETTDPAQARFIEVTVAPKTVQTILPPRMSKAVTRVTLDASSAAGFRFGTCGAQPIFVCNPYEGTGITIFQAENDPLQRGRQLRLVNPGGGNGKYGPGTWGYLDPFSQDGATPAHFIKDQLAMDKPTACFDSAGVRHRSGKIAGVDEALNVRFDMYKGQFKKPEYTQDNRFAPAANVTRGFADNGKGKGKGNSCGASPNPGAYALPQDSGLTDANYQGSGDWDFVTYLERNHGGPSPVTIDGQTYHIDYSARTVAPNAQPSRYSVYRWEIDNNIIPGPQSYGNQSTTPEEGRPTCHDFGAYQGDIDRRILTAAIVNCGENGELIAEADANDTTLPVIAFGEFFLTNPAGEDEHTELYLEFVGLLDGEDSLTRDQVALSR